MGAREDEQKLIGEMGIGAGRIGSGRFGQWPGSPGGGPNASVREEQPQRREVFRKQ